MNYHNPFWFSSVQCSLNWVDFIIGKYHTTTPHHAVFDYIFLHESFQSCLGLNSKVMLSLKFSLWRGPPWIAIRPDLIPTSTRHWPDLDPPLPSTPISASTHLMEAESSSLLEDDLEEDDSNMKNLTPNKTVTAGITLGWPLAGHLSALSALWQHEILCKFL